MSKAFSQRKPRNINTLLACTGKLWKPNTVATGRPRCNWRWNTGTGEEGRCRFCRRCWLTTAQNVLRCIQDILGLIYHLILQLGGVESMLRATRLASVHCVC